MLAAERAWSRARGPGRTVMAVLDHREVGGVTFAARQKERVAAAGMLVGGTDRTNHNFARIDPDPDFERRIAGFAQPCRIFPHLILHPEGREQRAMGVIFVRDRRTEQGEDSVASGLNYVAAIVIR